jgi:hypothetical protein
MLRYVMLRYVTLYSIVLNGLYCITFYYIMLHIILQGTTFYNVYFALYSVVVSYTFTRNASAYHRVLAAHST